MSDATITLEAKFITDLQRSLAAIKKQVSDVTDSIDKDFKGVNKTASAFLDTFKGFLAATGVITVLRGVGNAATGLAGGFIQANAAYETSVTSFRTLLKDGNKAKVLMQELTKFSVETPFESEPINQAAKSLLAFGSSSKNVVNELRMLGDIASGVGAPLGEIAEIYGKNRVQGRLFMQDINQLTGRGIPIIQELAKQFHVSEAAVRDLVEKGKVGFPQLEKAFQSLTAKGGQFSGMMAQQSQTFTGLMSTLKESVTQFFVTLGQTGVWAEFVKYLGQATTWLDKNQAKVQALAKTIGEGLITALRFTVDHFQELMMVGAAFLSAFAYAKIIPLVSAFTQAGGAVGLFSKALDLLKAHPALIAITAIPAVLNAITIAMEENARKAEEGGFRKNTEQLIELKKIAEDYNKVQKQISASYDGYEIQALSGVVGNLSSKFKDITGFSIDSAAGQNLLNGKTKEGISLIDLYIKKLEDQKKAQAAVKPEEQKTTAPPKVDLTPEQMEAIKKQRAAFQDSLVAIQSAGFEKDLAALNLHYQRQQEALKGNKEALKLLEQTYWVEYEGITQKNMDARQAKLDAAHAVTLEQEQLLKDTRINMIADEGQRERAMLDERHARELAAVKGNAAAIKAVKQRHGLENLEFQKKLTNSELELERQKVAFQLQTVGQIMGITQTLFGANKTMFMADKAFALAEATINMYLAIAKANALPPPLSIIEATRAKIQGGLAIAGIAATAIKGFEKGGLISGRNQMIMTNENGKTEAVLNNRAVRNIGPQGVAALNAGHGIGGGNVTFGNTQIIIQGNATQDTVSQIDSAISRNRDDQLREFAQLTRNRKKYGARG